MGYFLMTSREPSRATPIADPKTHTPRPQMQDLGLTFRMDLLWDGCMMPQ